MIRRFDRLATAYDHNKDILHPYSARVKERGNGFYELILEVPNKESAENGDLITVPTQRGEQPFRVYNTIRTLLGKKIFARHIFYDLAKSFLIDVRPTNATQQEALQTILSSAETSLGFTGLSDLTNRATAYYVRKNPVEAIMGEDNALLNLWGGYMIRDNKEIKIISAGTDRGYHIRLGKNLLGIEDESDESEVVTRLYPTVTIDRVVHALPEKYVDSPIMAVYGAPIIREVRVALTDEEEALTLEEIYPIMRSYCQNLYSIDNVDKPKSQYRVDFLQYRDDSSDFVNLMEKVELFDYVTVRVAELGIDVKLQVIEYEYNVLTQRYDSITLGSEPIQAKYQTANIIRQLQKEINQGKSDFAELWDTAINVITGNVGGFQITRRDSQNHPYETLWMDNENIALAQKVLRINKNGIAGSINGINGDYQVAITTDGWIVGERILTNSLSAISANLGTITAGVMQSEDGSISIDLTDAEKLGLRITDNGELVAAFTKEAGAVIPLLSANVLNTIDRTGTYGIGAGQQYSSINQCLLDLFKSTNRIHTGGDIWLNVTSDIIEDVDISGLQGTGRLIIQLNGVLVQGRFTIVGNQLPVYIIGGSSRGRTRRPPDSNNYTFEIHGSKYVQLNSLDIDGNYGSHLIDLTHGGNVHMQNCDIINAGYVVKGNNASVATLVDCRGNMTNGIFQLTEGAKGYLVGTAPAGGSIDNNNGGFTFQSGTVARTASTQMVPGVVDTEIKQVFSPSAIYTYHHNTTNKSSYYGATAAQNRWDTSTGWYDGVFKFGPEIYNLINGGTGITIRMRVRRKNSTHGTSNPVIPTPAFTVTQPFASAALRGAWSGWAELPTSLFTASGVELEFYDGSTGSKYAIWDAAEIEVTVTKSV